MVTQKRSRSTLDYPLKTRRCSSPCFDLPMAATSLILHAVVITMPTLQPRFLIELSVFSKELDLPLLKNTALDAFFLRIYVRPHTYPNGLIPYIHARTSTVIIMEPTACSTAAGSHSLSTVTLYTIKRCAGHERGDNNVNSFTVVSRSRLR